MPSWQLLYSVSGFGLLFQNAIVKRQGQLVDTHAVLINISSLRMVADQSPRRNAGGCAG